MFCFYQINFSFAMKTFEWIAMDFCDDVHGSQRTNLDVFGCPMAISSFQSFYLPCEIF